VNFEVTPAELARSNVDLVFEGLDAAAEIYVNGAQALTTDNSFRVWRVPVKDRLHCGRESAARGSFLRRSRQRMRRPLAIPSG